MDGLGATEVVVVLLLVVLPIVVIVGVVRLGRRGGGRSGQPPLAGAPGWHPDPDQRHEFRFWDGRVWTDRVSDRGHEATDPLESGPPRQVL